MSRGPLAYPLLRQLDGDAGGAADLQTDIMRFMAILSLCLMAIFALVQSLPETAATTSEVPSEVPSDVPPEPSAPDAAPATEVQAAGTAPAPAQPVVLQRAEAGRTPPAAPQPVPLVRARAPAPAAQLEPAPSPAPTESPPAPTPPAPAGFTLRFESDTALARLVATGQVGFFAMDDRGAQRMSVSDSRISFWAAPAPRQYHEMDGNTVPKTVRDALARTGRGGAVEHWAVTLPTRMTGELRDLMQRHTGGALVIGKDGSLRREAT